VPLHPAVAYLHKSHAYMYLCVYIHLHTHIQYVIA
jgi:hypothetical protein